MSAAPLKNRIVLITGASSGIGKGLAVNFAKDGWHLVLAARNVDQMQALAEDLNRRHGITATVIGADLATEDGARFLHAEVKRRGIVISALVNNAGHGASGEFKDSDLPSNLAMMRLNMTAVVILTSLFMPDLLACRGKLLNVASTAAFQPGPYMAVYFATKSFVLSFSEALASEIEDAGVTVTALCPGPTQSEFWNRPEMRKSALGRRKSLPSSEEVARHGYRAMQDGKRVMIPGLMNRLTSQSVRFMPRRLVTAVVKAMNKPT